MMLQIKDGGQAKLCGVKLKTNIIIPACVDFNETIFVSIQIDPNFFYVTEILTFRQSL